MVKIVVSLYVLCHLLQPAVILSFGVLGESRNKSEASKDKMREGEKVAEQRHSAKMLDKTDLWSPSIKCWDQKLLNYHFFKMGVLVVKHE